MNQINSGDLFNKKFSSGFRGYDKSQVENHIQTLSREFEILENKILDLENKIKEQKTENDKFKSVESSLISTLKTAEDTAKGIIEKAKEDAKGILDDASYINLFGEIPNFPIILPCSLVKTTMVFLSSPKDSNFINILPTDKST